jgi:hypothetical protein
VTSTSGDGPVLDIAVEPSSLHPDTRCFATRSAFEGLCGCNNAQGVIMPSAMVSKYPDTSDGKIPASPDTPIPDPLVWLALATLDQLSGGRVELGLPGEGASSDWPT